MLELEEIDIEAKVFCIREYLEQKKNHGLDWIMEREKHENQTKKQMLFFDVDYTFRNCMEEFHKNESIMLPIQTIQRINQNLAHL